jgi:hypothetical protein
MQPHTLAYHLRHRLFPKLGSMARGIALEGLITCWPIVLEESRLDSQAVMISFASSTFTELAEQYIKWGSYFLQPKPV